MAFDKNGVWCANMDVFLPCDNSNIIFFSNSSSSNLTFFGPGNDNQALVVTKNNDYWL